MKTIKKGQVILFVCNSCGCEFVVGIHVVNTPDDGENYYANCPMCGADCHTDCAKIQITKGKKTNDF